MKDDIFNLPMPPVDSVSNVLVDMWATGIYTTISLFALIYGIYFWRKTGRTLVFWMLIGGGFCSVVEPYVNIMGAVWHPHIDQWLPVFDIMGRSMPSFLVTGYIFYFGALGTFSILAMERGLSTKQFWLLALIPMVVDVAMEELMLYWDLYIYYGNQPLIIFNKLPLWWVPCNAIGSLLGVCVIYLGMQWIKGWKQILIPIIMVVADAAVYAAISLPSWIVVNSDVPWWLNQLGGLATVGLAFLLLYVLSQIIPKDSPFQKMKNYNQYPSNN